MRVGSLPNALGHATPSKSLPGAWWGIFNKAFHRCTQPTAAVLEEGLEEIGVGAFFDRTLLRDVTIPTLRHGDQERYILSLLKNYRMMWKTTIAPLTWGKEGVLIQYRWLPLSFRMFYPLPSTKTIITVMMIIAIEPMTILGREERGCVCFFAFLSIRYKNNFFEQEKNLALLMMLNRYLCS